MKGGKRTGKLVLTLVIALLVAALALAAVFGRGTLYGRPETVDIGGRHRNASNGGESTGEPEDTDPPVLETDPRAAFVSGAKRMAATDLMAGEEGSGGSMGILSKLLDDLNNRSHEATITFTIQDIVSDGEPSDENVFINLNTRYNIDTADASLEIGFGMGTEEASYSGIYITGSQALLRSASVEKNMILYEIPSGDYTGMTFIDRLSGLLGSIGQDSAEAPAGLSGNVEKREAMAARHLDPWLTDTLPEEYARTEETRTVLGAEQTCAVITFTLTGERAHTFLLDKLRALEADPDFEGFGSFSGSIDLSSIGSDEAAATAAPGESPASPLIEELEAYTAEQIAALTFTASVAYYQEEPIGFEISAATTEKVFSLSLYYYSLGLENQGSFYLGMTDGTSISLQMSKLSAGGDLYNSAMSVSMTDGEGVETIGGQYNGTVTQNDSEYTLDSDFSFIIRNKDADTGAINEATVSGSAGYAQAPSPSGGYTGEGQLVLSLDSQDSNVSMTLALSTDVQFPADVTIAPPMYTEASVTRVSDEQGLYEALGLDWEEMQAENAFTRALALIFSVIAGQ